MMKISLTEKERTLLIQILNGELDNEDDYSGDYFDRIRSLLKKLSS